MLALLRQDLHEALSEFVYCLGEPVYLVGVNVNAAADARRRVTCFIQIQLIHHSSAMCDQVAAHETENRTLPKGRIYCSREINSEVLSELVIRPF
jgi:hypothetical protein